MAAVVREVSLDAPAGEVWRALTDAEELSAWFGADVTGDLVADGAAAIGDRLALLTDAEELHRLGFRWADGGDVEFTITDAGEGSTRLRVVETSASVSPRASATASAARWDGRLTALAASCGRLVLAGCR